MTRPGVIRTYRNSG